jgi:hypothetical protein
MRIWALILSIAFTLGGFLAPSPASAAVLSIDFGRYHALVIGNNAFEIEGTDLDVMGGALP